MKSICEITPEQFVFTVNLQCTEPYAVVVSKNTNAEEKYIIPEQLAYFFITHWAGTNELRESIRREILNEIKNVLGIK